MKILFLSLSSLPHLSEHSISLDLLHELIKRQHSVYVICSKERRYAGHTSITEEAGCKIVRVKTGNLTKVNMIEKGMATILLPLQYKRAIKKYLKEVKFDLVIYPTPPITQYHTVKFIKNRDGARTYLLLKDIFPQNAVDIGILKTNGIKGLIYRYFRRLEKKLYEVSDRIGCMSDANVEYLLNHNKEIDKYKVEVCPNCVEPIDMSVDNETKTRIRKKYNIPLDKVVFVYGGNLGRPQGIPFLFECLKSQKENSRVFFLIVGDGTEYNRLKDCIEKEKFENVKLMCRLPKSEYDWLVAGCDVGMIFLDHRFTIPNFPSRLLSYMQAKLPVLAVTDPNTDIGKIIVEGEFGWWCESDNVKCFVQKINIACAENRNAKGIKAWEYFKEHYTAEKGYEKMLMLPEKLEKTTIKQLK